MSAKQPSLFQFGVKSSKNQEKQEENDPQKNTPESKKNYETFKRKREFLAPWLLEFAGLKHDGEKGMTCEACTRFKEIAGQTNFVSGCKTYRKNSIQSHWESPRHLLAANALLCVQQGGEGPLDVVVRKLGEKNMKIITAMFNTAYFVIHEEMPLATFPSLMQLQSKNGSDLRRLLSYSSDKACAR